MKYLTLILPVLMLASCNPDDTTIPTATEKKLLFSKITFVPDNAADPSYEIWPTYDANGMLTTTKTVYSFLPNDTFIDRITENKFLFSIKFPERTSFSELMPYLEVKFHQTNGRLDSIVYKEDISFPYLGGGIRKRTYEYNSNQLKTVREFGYLFGELTYSMQYSSLLYEDGLLRSYVTDSSDTSYNKVTLSYFPESEWNADGFNTYFFERGTFSYGLLYISPYYFHPILMNEIKYMNNEKNALIKSVRYQGFYFKDGIKEEYDIDGGIMDYLFDQKGRVIESSNRYGPYGFNGRLKFEYKD
jgi:hypothetical protein